MSDVGSLTAKDRERSKAFRMVTYFSVFIFFIGANFAYRLQGAAFDFASGFVFAIFIYSVVGYLKGWKKYNRLALLQLISYRNADYKLTNLFKGTGIWYVVVPILAMPFLLYVSDFPIQLVRFGASFLVGYLGIYVCEIAKTLNFYREFDQYVNWEKIEAEVATKTES